MQTKEMIKQELSTILDVECAITAHKIADVIDASLYPAPNAPEDNCDVFANVAPVGLATHMTGKRHKAIKKHRKEQGLVFQSMDTTLDLENGFLQLDFHYGKKEKKQKWDRWGRRPLPAKG